MRHDPRATVHGVLLLPSEAVRGRQHLLEFREGAAVLPPLSPFLQKVLDERKKWGLDRPTPPPITDIFSNGLLSTAVAHVIHAGIVSPPQQVLTLFFSGQGSTPQTENRPPVNDLGLSTGRFFPDLRSMMQLTFLFGWDPYDLQDFSNRFSPLGSALLRRSRTTSRNGR